MTTISALSRFAAQQHDLIRTRDLRALGFTPAAVRHLVADERIFRVHHGVYVFGRPTLTREARWLAAVLASPDGSALGHVSAAVLWELLTYESGWPHVIVPARRSNRGRPGMVTHRSLDLTEEDVARRDAIRVTTVLRTLIDLSRSRLGDRPLNGAVRQAARLHHADLRALAGVPRLGRMVRLYDPLAGMTESQLEVRFVELCVRHRLPRPTPQFAFGPFRADFVFDDQRVAIELDSRRWHDNDVNFLTDRRKERLIRATGYELLRFTWAEVVHEPARVAAEIRAALNRRAQKVSL